MVDQLRLVGTLNNTNYSACGLDILVAQPGPGYKDNAELARAAVGFQQDFARGLGKKCGLVIVMNNLLTQDAASRKIYSDGTTPELFYGVAFVVNNPLARAIGSFALGLARVEMPITLVDSVDGGIAWLEQVKTGQGR